MLCHARHAGAACGSGGAARGSWTPAGSPAPAPTAVWPRATSLSAPAPREMLRRTNAQQRLPSTALGPSRGPDVRPVHASSSRRPGRRPQWRGQRCLMQPGEGNVFPTPCAGAAGSGLLATPPGGQRAAGASAVARKRRQPAVALPPAAFVSGNPGQDAARTRNPGISGIPPHKIINSGVCFSQTFFMELWVPQVQSARPAAQTVVQ